MTGPSRSAATGHAVHRSVQRRSGTTVPGPAAHRSAAVHQPLPQNTDRGNTARRRVRNPPDGRRGALHRPAVPDHRPPSAPLPGTGTRRTARLRREPARQQHRLHQTTRSQRSPATDQPDRTEDHGRDGRRGPARTAVDRLSRTGRSRGGHRRDGSGAGRRSRTLPDRTADPAGRTEVDRRQSSPRSVSLADRSRASSSSHAT